MILSIPGKPTTTKDIAGSIRWMAAEFFQVPELDLDAALPIKKATKETDVWAFGMTVLASNSLIIHFVNHQLAYRSCLLGRSRSERASPISIS